MAWNWSQTKDMEESGLLPSRRHMALHLPLWPTDCLKRRDPALKALAAPLVLYDKQKGALRLVAVDRAAAQARLFVGQSLSEARALCPKLEAREIDHALLEAVFADFADWHSYVSPIVAVLAAPNRYGDLVIDITGVAHLFGGEAAMLKTVTGRLRRLGFTVAGSVAGSVGAAWALSHHAADAVVEAQGTAAALAELPVVALRLDEVQVAGLTRMGLKRVGQLFGRDRKALAARFGASLLLRLDQALGFIEERVVPRLPVAERHAERRFADPIGLMDDVLACAHDLAVQLALRLEGEGFGAQSFHLFLYRVDHKVMCLSVNAARATRDADHISRLFSNRSERLEGDYDAGFGIDMIRLAASSVSPLDPAQVGAFETRDGAEDLDRLYDRMASRLGPLAVVRSRFVNTHIPERAVVLEPVIARTPDDPQAAPDPEAPRPLRLLPAPEPIVVYAEAPDGPPGEMTWRRVKYRFVKASGPNRIEVEWWRTGEKLDLLGPRRTRPPETDEKGNLLRPPPYVPKLAPFVPQAGLRDYYVAEDEGGRRFWIFRQGVYGLEAGPRWFLHGFFP